MMSDKIARLQRENRKLVKAVVTLQNDNKVQLQNSLFSLVDAAFKQNNLTSLNPILQSNIYAPLTINWTALTYMYKTHGLIQTAIDMPVLDALRDGIDIQSGELSTDEIKDVQDYLEEKDILGVIGEAETWARLYGGGAIIVNAGQNPETPLDQTKIDPDMLELYPANRWELGAPWKLDEAKALATPWAAAAPRITDFYVFYGQKIHKSRVLTLSGKAAPYIVRWQLAGWGMSEVERMVEDFNSYIKTKQVTYELLNEAKIDVYRLLGFRDQLVTSVGTEKVRTRLELMNQQKNYNNAIIMDKEDEFEQKQITFTGIAEVMKQNMVGIASALRMPMTKLFGLSASGFNSGEDDIENYNGMVMSEVRRPIRRVLRKILNLVFMAKHGFEPDYSFEYKPLRVIGAVEEEAIKTSKSNRILGMYDRMLLDSREVGEMMEKDKLVSVETCAAKGILEDHPAKPEEAPSFGEEKGKGGEKEKVKVKEE